MDNVRFNPRLADIVPYDPKYLPADVMVSANENPDGLPAPVLAYCRTGTRCTYLYQAATQA